MKISLFMAISSVLALYFILEKSYIIGYVTGYHIARDTSYLKNRIIKEGNVIKYPFKKTDDESYSSIECNSLKQSVQDPKEGD